MMSVIAREPGSKDDAAPARERSAAAPMSAVIRVLHVLHWPVSGIASLLHGLGRHMSTEGIESHVVFFRCDKSANAEFATICRSVHCLEVEQGAYAAPLRLYRHWRAVAPDIVHTHSFQPVVWTSLLPFDQRRHVTTVHSNYPYLRDSDFKSRLKRFLEIGVLKARPIQTIAVGRQVYELLDGLAVPRKRLTLIENGVDFGHWPLRTTIDRDVRNELDIGDDNFALLSLGRLDIRTKGYDLLLRALQQVRAKYERVVLVLVGDGPDRARLVQMAEALGIASAVRFVGHTSSPQRYVCAADAYVSSSVVEGFGLAVAEAMLCGVPTIASRVGAASDMIVHRQSGLLVEPGDVRAIVSAVFEFVEGRHDLKAMGERGRREVLGRFDLRVTASAYAALYRKLLGGQPQ